jgi:hypothetical protein
MRVRHRGFGDFMKTGFQPLLLSCLSLAGLAAATPETAIAVCDPDGHQVSGAVYRICMPPAGLWNGDLVIWAHGYVAFNRPVAIPEDQLRLPDGTSIPDIANGLGYAFATTSYSVNGTAVRQGLADVVDLVSVFEGAKGPVGHVYLTGASEGGLITTLATEQRPDLFSGGLAACGPIGSFPGQVGYYGDFRVLLDYYFPRLLPGSAIQIPPALISNWDAYYSSVVRPAMFAPINLGKTLELIRVAHVPTDPNPANFWASAERSLRDALWYNVFATNDAIEKLGGQPFDNRRTLYLGSSNDLFLNFRVKRYSADPVAVAEMRSHYDTTGVLGRPLVTLQTLYDQQVPSWQQSVYTLKVAASGSLDQLIPLTIDRYGHCNFTPAEVLVSFVLMVLKSEGVLLENAERALPLSSRREFRRLTRQHGLPLSRN